MPTAQKPAPTRRPAAKRTKNAARKRGMKRQEAHRVLLGELRRSNYFNELGLPKIRPEDALDEALKRAVITARHASAQVEAIRPEDYFRIVINDNGILVTPDAWIKEEQLAWERAAHLAARMASLGLEERSVEARERASEAFATALEAVASRLGLSDEQRALLPNAIRQGLPEVVEGVVSESK